MSDIFFIYLLPVYAMSDIFFIYLLPVYGLVIMFALIFFEGRYYDRHPEKTRPSGEDPYGPHLN